MTELCILTPLLGLLASALAPVPHLYRLHSRLIRHQRLSQLLPTSPLPRRLYLVHWWLCSRVDYSSCLCIARL